MVVFGGGVVRLGLCRLRAGRSGGVGLGVVAVLWRGVAGLGSAVLPGTAGRLVLGGTVRAAAGVLTGLAGLPACGPAAGPVPSGAGSARVQVSGMPGLAPLTRVAVPAFSIASRAARAAGLPVPAASAMTATALPGLAASAAERPLPGCRRRVRYRVPGRGPARRARRWGRCRGWSSCVPFRGSISFPAAFRFACVRLFLDDNRSAPDMKSSRSADIFRSCRKQ